MTTTFTAQVDASLDAFEEAMLWVMRDSIADTVEMMQAPKGQGGRMPVDTGNLRNSLVSGLNGEFGPSGAASFALVVNNMDLGDNARFGYTAAYARRMELGFEGTDAAGRTYSQSGNLFMTTAAAAWPTTVSANARKHAR